MIGSDFFDMSCTLCAFVFRMRTNNEHHCEKENESRMSNCNFHCKTYCDEV